MIDHDTDSYKKIARGLVDGKPSGNLTREHIVDNITLYWLTGTGVGCALVLEEGQENAGAAGQAPTPVSIRSASRRSRGDLADPRAGSRRRTPTSSTSTRWTRAVTSPLGRNRALGRVARRLPPAALAGTRELGVTCTTGDWPFDGSMRHWLDEHNCRSAPRPPHPNLSLDRRRIRRIRNSASWHSDHAQRQRLVRGHCARESFWTAYCQLGGPGRARTGRSAAGQAVGWFSVLRWSW